MSDQEIIHGLRSNNNSALKDFIRDFTPRTKKFVAKLGSSKFEFDDIFQESVVILWQNLIKEDFILSSTLTTYFFGIVFRVTREKQRSRSHTISIDAIKELTLEENWDLDLVFKRDQELKEMWKIISTLGEGCRQILRYRYNEERSINYIRSAMGFKSEGVVRNKLSRCIEQIRKKYKFEK